MHPLAYRLLSAWSAVAFIVGGVDAYNGLECKNATGGYIRPLPGNSPAAHFASDVIMAIPYGVGRGALYNVGQGLSTEGACGRAGYTHRFAGGISRLFGTPVAGKVYAGSQALFGLPGAMLGGLAAEEVHTFSGRSLRDIRLPPLHHK